MSHHCHDEHASHGHGHGGDHDHDHSDDITPALQHSLYQQIHFDEVEAFNEATAGSARAVVKKTWAERMTEEPEVVSDADEQLLVNVPFTAQTLHVFLNRHDIDFSSADDATPTQTFELSQTSEIQELPVRRARFNAVRRLTLFFPDNFGDGDEDVTRISYLGFRGEWTALGRAPQNILYEAAANPGDHRVKGVGVRNQGDVNF